MKIHSGFFILISASLLAGCATEKNISMSETFWQHKPEKMTIAESKPIKPALYKVGNQGLLDMAINSAMTKTLNEQIEKSDETWYQSLPKEFANRLEKHNIKVRAVSEVVGDDEKSYPAFAARLGADELLVIRLEAFGATRNYYSFIPTGAPKAYCELYGELTNEKTHTVLWRHRAMASEMVQGPWDQPPTYPNLMNAIKLAASNAQEELLDSFFSGH